MSRPLFVHERLSTQAIIETLKSHRKDTAQTSLFDLFGDPQRPLADAITKAYEHQDKWVNRLILGDSLVVMNSLLRYEGLGGQVQMIYIDPPYGVKFGSNFQPFVREKNVSNNDDDDMTREPEMVKAYRDTWDLGLHSYLAYLRDRLALARELLHPSGSVFVQISDENFHSVRYVLDLPKCVPCRTMNSADWSRFRRAGRLAASAPRPPRDLKTDEANLTIFEVSLFPVRVTGIGATIRVLEKRWTASQQRIASGCQMETSVPCFC
jgi:DNA methylase